MHCVHYECSPSSRKLSPAFGRSIVVPLQNGGLQIGRFGITLLTSASFIRSAFGNSVQLLSASWQRTQSGCTSCSKSMCSSAEQVLVKLDGCYITRTADSALLNGSPSFCLSNYQCVYSKRWRIKCNVYTDSTSSRYCVVPLVPYYGSTPKRW